MTVYNNDIDGNWKRGYIEAFRRATNAMMKLTSAINGAPVRKYEQRHMYETYLAPKRSNN